MLTNSEFMWPHTDDGNPDDPRKIVFGIAIYLNDDFRGGELIYPDLGLSVTPKAGSMVIHKAHLKHQVFPVLGERYSITTFVFGDESTKFIPIIEK
jgi:Rps23 Pro-64 3,4-dihydroxylase Tpa1-like proline 4-hydroxylase